MIVVLFWIVVALLVSMLVGVAVGYALAWCDRDAPGPRRPI